jgi:sulfhydrogenase subunit beta (sulfur reductase)
MHKVSKPHAFITTLEGLQRLLDLFVKRGFTVYGPVLKGKSWVFSEIHSISEVDLNYTRSILPPKKLLLPPKSSIFSFKLNGDFEILESCDFKNVVLFGAHPCDLKAIEKLDGFLSLYPEDVCYKARRQGLFIVGLTCNVVDEHCFCSSLGIGPEASTGFDILITQIGENFLVESGSLKGLNILERIELPRGEI